jgi:acetyl-CoA carboxylase biotin carboxyl carrier protein
MNSRGAQAQRREAMSEQQDKSAADDAAEEKTNQEAHLAEAKANRESQTMTSGRHRRRERHRHAMRQTPPPQTAAHPDASINMDELREVVELIASHGFTDFELEREGFRVRLRRELAPQSIQAPPVQNPAPNSMPFVASVEPAPQTIAAAKTDVKSESAPSESEADDKDLHIITSPIVGTFYRAPAPGAEPFVKVGSHIEHDTVVCIVEAMKLMNEIQAETTGTVAKIYVENGQPVEYGQPLFGIKQ